MTKHDQTSPPGRGGEREHPDPARGRRIIDAREAKRLTQKKLAQAIGGTERRISDWQKGEPISTEYLLKLADALDVSADYIEFGALLPAPELTVDNDQLDRIEGQLERLLADHRADEEQVHTIAERLASIEDRLTSLEKKNPYQAILRLLRLVEADRSRPGRDLGKRDLQGRDGLGRREVREEGVA